MRLPQELLDRINSANLKEQMKAQRENLASNKIENVLPVAVRWMAYGWLAWVGIDVYRFLMSDIVRPIWGVLKGMLALITVLSLVAIIHTPAWGESCTKGTDCYCDCVTGTDRGDGYKNDQCEVKYGGVGVPVDSVTTYMCEDYEAPTLQYDQDHESAVGNGAPYYGPPYDDTGWTGMRGGNAYWLNVFNTGSGQAWLDGQPASPTYGPTCDADALSLAQCGQCFWHPTDLWQGNDCAALAVLQNGQFNDEVSSIGSGPALYAGGNGVFDGVATLAQRTPAEAEMGVNGFKYFAGGSFVRTFGVTQALAYPSNSITSGIWAAPWKHNEWGGSATGDGAFLFHLEAGNTNTTAPFDQIIFVFPCGDPPCETEASIAAKVAAATVSAGYLNSNASQVLYGPTTAGSPCPGGSTCAYTRSTHFPVNTWGCVRGHFEDWGTSSSKARIWFTGSDGIERLLVHFEGMDLTGTNAKDGYNGLVVGNYANTNAVILGGDPTTETTYRYEDNMHIRNGSPATCAQIGFGSEGAPPESETGSVRIARMGTFILMGLIFVALATKKLVA